MLVSFQYETLSIVHVANSENKDPASQKIYVFGFWDVLSIVHKWIEITFNWKIKMWKLPNVELEF